MRCEACASERAKRGVAAAYAGRSRAERESEQGRSARMRCVACASESLNQVNIKIIAKKKAPAYCRSSDKKKIIKKPSEELNSQCTFADERNAKCII